MTNNFINLYKSIQQKILAKIKSNLMRLFVQKDKADRYLWKTRWINSWLFEEYLYEFFELYKKKIAIYWHLSIVTVKFGNYRLSIPTQLYNCQNKSSIYRRILFHWYNYFHILTLGVAKVWVRTTAAINR